MELHRTLCWTKVLFAMDRNAQTEAGLEFVTRSNLSNPTDFLPAGFYPRNRVG